VKTFLRRYYRAYGVASPGRLLLAGFLVGGCISNVVAATDPDCPAIAPVFTAGENGYHTYRIPALVVTTNGTLLAFCEGRKYSRSDTGDIDLLLKRSTDGGHTWSPQQVIWSDDCNTCGNPAPVVDRQTGLVWLLMTWNRGTNHESEITTGGSKESRRVFCTHSSDDGKTWAEPSEITAAVKRPEWRWYATGPVNGIQLEHGPQAGRLVVPCNHTSAAKTNAASRAVSRSHIIYSDDHGRTWQIGGVEEERTNESTLVELVGGRLLHNMRSYRGHQQRATALSLDGGETWGRFRDEPVLIEPVCQASLFRYSWPQADGPGQILFCNPASTNKRQNLTVRVSSDEGESWPSGRVLWSGPAAYSCLALRSDQTILCLFESGQTNPYESIRLAQFPLSWLEAGAEPK